MKKVYGEKHSCIELRQSQCVPTTYETYLSRILSISFASLKHLNLPISIKMPVTIWQIDSLRNEFNFWNVQPISEAQRASPSGFMLTLQETRSIHDSMNILKIEFIAYIYISL